VDVNEVQVITTTAAPKAEIQALIVSPPPGHFNLDASWSYSIQLDTSARGGSVQFSGQISSTAGADGYRGSVSDVLGSMMNINEIPLVSKSEQNPDGGFTYTITFPLAMGDVPEMEVYLSDIPVSVTTLEEGNILGGSFRLEFDGEITEQIAFDSSSSLLQSKLEKLPSIGSISVIRSSPDSQNGFSWRIEFTSDQNSGNLNNIICHGEGLTTTNIKGGAEVNVGSGGIDGSYIRGSFQVEFGKQCLEI